MKTEKFKIGDVVQLKSGGPKMTVASEQDKYGYDDFESVRCQWFVGTKMLSELIAVKALERVE